MALCILIAFLVGVLLGLILPRKTAGVLRIDHSNPEKDIYRLELEDLDGLGAKSRIVLWIDNDADLSQK